MRIRIKKLKEADNPTHPNNIEEGFETIKSMPFELFNKPEVGKCFWAGTFKTSQVQEILSPNKFRTHNSIYEWELLDRIEKDSIEKDPMEMIKSYHDRSIPFIILSAQDKHVMAPLTAYLTLVEENPSISEEYKQGVFKIIEGMSKWRNRNHVKDPD